MSTTFRISRRKFALGLATSLAAIPFVAKRGFAQDYPSGPVQILVAYGAGGGTDTLARVLAPALSRKLNTPVTVQNLPGGGGQVAATTLLREGGDGLAILATNEPDLSLSTVFAKPPYKITDFQIIMVDIYSPLVLLLRKEDKISSFADFVARAKAEPDKLTVSVTQGAGQEYLGKWLIEKLGLRVRIVGYGGGAPAINALLAGDVTASVSDDFARFNLRDKLKALLVGSDKISPRWPEALTLTDALAPLGVVPPSPSFMARRGVYVVPASFKAERPKEYAKLQRALIQARDEPEFQKYVVKSGMQDVSIGKPGEKFAAAFAQDLAAVSAWRK